MGQEWKAPGGHCPQGAPPPPPPAQACARPEGPGPGLQNLLFSLRRCSKGGPQAGERPVGTSGWSPGRGGPAVNALGPAYSGCVLSFCSVTPPRQGKRLPGPPGCLASSQLLPTPAAFPEQTTFLVTPATASVGCRLPRHSDDELAWPLGLPSESPSCSGVLHPYRQQFHSVKPHLILGKSPDSEEGGRDATPLDGDLGPEAGSARVSAAAEGKRTHRNVATEPPKQSFGSVWTLSPNAPF